MKGWLKKQRNEIISVAILVALVFATVYIAFGLYQNDLSTPLIYDGKDDFTSYKNAKLLSEGTQWIYATERLGAPFGAEYYDFLPDSLTNVEHVIVKFFGLFTKDAVENVNMASYFLFFLVAIIAYYVLRELGVRNDFAIVGALAFDFSYYHFVRMIEHFALGAYEFVPLSILLCVWLWKDERLFRIGRDFFRYKRNYAVILFAFLIANNGIAYYAFFTCMFLGLTALSKCIKQKKWRAFLPTLGVILTVVIFMALALLPCFIYQTNNGTVPTVRNMWDSEIFGLRILQLLIPYKNTAFFNEYYESFLKTEAHGSYLGWIGILGFLFLLVRLLMKSSKETETKDTIRLFAELNVFAVLFATMGGFSSILFNFVISLIRGVNRISIFISFLSIATVCLGMTEFMKRSKVQWKKKARGFCYVLFLLFCVGGIVEQIPWNLTDSADSYREEKESDQAFIEEIEKTTSEGAMIYQLPYKTYPEGGPQHEMSDYHLLTGYIYSDTLRWSFGGSRGRESDIWNQKMSELEYQELIVELKKEGFAGLYVDKRAYDEANFEHLYNVVNICVGTLPINSKNNNLYFWKF